jgi:hypothetical protein
MNISTGMHATREVQDSLPNTIEAAACLSNGKLAFFKS